VQEQRDVQPAKARQQDDRETPVRRIKRPERERQAKEQPPKEALKSVIKSAPPVAKEGPAPRPSQSLPWGFGGE
jgi:hypothetical protein